MKELSRFELANCKRTAKSVQQFRVKKNRLEEKIAVLQKELDTINVVIEKYEAPIIELTGGFTSEQVLSGEMDLALAKDQGAALAETLKEEEAPAEVAIEAAEEEQPASAEPVNPFGLEPKDINGLPFEV
jgi:peptidoglycan hydrolase CwlO-like protein